MHKPWGTFPLCTDFPGSITDLQALYLSGTYCHKTGTRPPSCNMPRGPTIYQ